MFFFRQDREIRDERSLRGEDPGPPRRISAVTRARMQQRKQIQAMLIKSEAAMKTRFDFCSFWRLSEMFHPMLSVPMAKWRIGTSGKKFAKSLSWGDLAKTTAAGI